MNKEQRQQDADKYHRAIIRGRHPRSFPNQAGLWSFVKDSNERLDKVKYGQVLSSIVGTDKGDILTLSKLSGEASRENNGLSRLFWLKDGQKLFGADLVNDSMTNVANGYLSNYENSAVRTEKQSRRLSMFRQYKNEKMRQKQNQNEELRRRSTLDPIRQGEKLPITLSNSQQPSDKSRKISASNFAKRRSVMLEWTILSASQARQARIEYTPKRDQGTAGSKRKEKSKRRQKHKKNIMSMVHPKEDLIKQQQALAKDFIDNATKRYIDKTDSVQTFLQQQRQIDKIGKASTNSLGLSSKSMKLANKIFLGKTIKTSTSSAADSTQMYELASAESNLFYGCQLALEYQDEHFLSIDTRSGNAVIRHHTVKYSSEQDTSLAPKLCVGDKSIAVFTIFKLNDVDDVSPIYDGDDVWLAICSGSGQPGWADGSVIGSKVDQVPSVDKVSINRIMKEYKNYSATSDSSVMKAEGRELISESEKKVLNKLTRKTSQSTEPNVVGKVTPVTAYVPRFKEKGRGGEKSLEELHREIDLQTIIQRRNMRASYVGRWKIRISNASKNGKNDRQCSVSNVNGINYMHGKEAKRSPIKNSDSVYFEQDCVVMTAASTVLKSKQNNRPDEYNDLHGQNKNTKDIDLVLRKMNDPKDNVHSRRCQWRVLVIDQYKGKAGARSHSKESCLFQARLQLNESEQHRNGNIIYGPDLCSGSKFPKQIRAVRQTLENEVKEAYLLPLEKLQPELNKYFVERFWNMNDKLEDTFCKSKTEISDVWRTQKVDNDTSSDVDTCSCSSCCATCNWEYKYDNQLRNPLKYRDETWYKHYEGGKHHEELRPVGCKPWINQVFSLRLEDISVYSEMEKSSAKFSQKTERKEYNIQPSLTVSLDLKPEVENLELAGSTEEETKKTEMSKAIADIIAKIQEQDKKLWDFQSSHSGGPRGSALLQ